MLQILQTFRKFNHQVESNNYCWRYMLCEDQVNYARKLSFDILLIATTAPQAVHSPFILYLEITELIYMNSYRLIYLFLCTENTDQYVNASFSDLVKGLK